MAGQAGWYRAPGEAGLLRWWNGSIWTDHRQPDPAAVSAPDEIPALIEPDPMEEYERQFDVPSLPDLTFDRPAYDFDVHGGLTSAPVVAAPTPEFAGTAPGAQRSLGPIALGPATPTATPVVEARESEFDRMYNDMAALAATPTKDAAPATPDESTSLTPPVLLGVTPNRKAVLGAARIMAAAILIIVLGVAAMVILSFQSLAGPGEAQTNAIVTSLGTRTSSSCAPAARFAVDGRSYTAKSSAAISPCPIGLGESVDVVYSAANPASAARIEVGTSVAQYLWIVPILGGLVFVGGLITFIVRAGSIVGGVRLLREGRAEKKKPVVAG